MIGTRRRGKRVEKKGNKGAKDRGIGKGEKEGKRGK